MSPLQQQHMTPSPRSPFSSQVYQNAGNDAGASANGVYDENEEEVSTSQYPRSLAKHPIKQSRSSGDTVLFDTGDQYLGSYAYILRFCGFIAPFGHATNRSWVRDEFGSVSVWRPFIMLLWTSHILLVIACILGNAYIAVSVKDYDYGMERGAWCGLYFLVFFFYLAVWYNVQWRQVLAKDAGRLFLQYHQFAEFKRQIDAKEEEHRELKRKHRDIVKSRSREKELRSAQKRVEGASAPASNAASSTKQEEDSDRSFSPSPSAGFDTSRSTQDSRNGPHSSPSPAGVVAGRLTTSPTMVPQRGVSLPLGQSLWDLRNENGSLSSVPSELQFLQRVSKFETTWTVIFVGGLWFLSYYFVVESLFTGNRPRGNERDRDADIVDFLGSERTYSALLLFSTLQVWMVISVAAVTVSYVVHILIRRTLLLSQTAERVVRFEMNVEFIEWLLEQETSLVKHFALVDAWSRIPVYVLALGSGSFLSILVVILISNKGQYPSIEAFIIPFLVISCLSMRECFLYLFHTRLGELRALINNLKRRRAPKMHNSASQGVVKYSESMPDILMSSVNKSSSILSIGHISTIKVAEEEDGGEEEVEEKRMDERQAAAEDSERKQSQPNEGPEAVRQSSTISLHSVVLDPMSPVDPSSPTPLRDDHDDNLGSHRHDSDGAHHAATETIHLGRRSSTSRSRAPSSPGGASPLPRGHSVSSRQNGSASVSKALEAVKAASLRDAERERADSKGARNEIVLATYASPSSRKRGKKDSNRGTAIEAPLRRTSDGNLLVTPVGQAKENNPKGWNNLHGVWVAYRHLLWTAALYAFIWVCIFTLRLVIQFPQCLEIKDEDGNFELDDKPCSSTWNTIRYFESAYVGHVLHYVFIGVVVTFMAKRSLVINISRSLYVLAVVVGTIVFVVKVIANDPQAEIDVINFTVTWIVTTIVCVSLSRKYGGVRVVGLLFFLLETLYILIRSINSFIIIPLYTKWTSSQRVIIVLVYHPLISATMTHLVSLVQSEIIERIPNSQKPYAERIYFFQFGAQVLLRPLGRMFLLNIDDAYSQVASAVILSTVDSSMQLLRPTRAYYFYRAIGKTVDEANRHKERIIHDRTWRHDEYMRMAIELFSIVACGALSVIFRWYYSVPQSVSTIAWSVAIQLVAEIFISDLWSGFLEAFFYKASSKVWVDHQLNGSYTSVALASLCLVGVVFITVRGIPGCCFSSTFFCFLFTTNRFLSLLFISFLFYLFFYFIFLPSLHFSSALHSLFSSSLSSSTPLGRRIALGLYSHCCQHC